MKKKKSVKKNILKATGVVAYSAVLIAAGIFVGVFVGNFVDTASWFGRTPEQIDAKIEAQVFPEEGYKTKIVLGDAVLKLIEGEAIDTEKFNALYERRGGLPEELKDVLTQPSNEPIHLTKENANIYLNILWALGLSNYMEANKTSPINGENLNRFAATGGWSLGKEDRGGGYFNSIAAVPLTLEQEALVVKIGESTFRPCCNNSTYFQDCNHGSALLGMLQLGAAQGLSEIELYEEALAFNSYWFPDNYKQTALYFKKVQKTDWDDVDPRVILSSLYSSGSGFRQNVAGELAKLNLIPQKQGGASCGV